MSEQHREILIRRVGSRCVRIAVSRLLKQKFEVILWMSFVRPVRGLVRSLKSFVYDLLSFCLLTGRFQGLTTRDDRSERMPGFGGSERMPWFVSMNFEPTRLLSL